mgnify:CR=1 FL=1
MIRKSMKMEVWGVWEPLGGAWGASWSKDGAQERQEEPKEALMANFALRWANLARNWGPKSMENRYKIEAKVQFRSWFFGKVLEGFWKGFGRILKGFWKDFGKILGRS